MLGFREVDRLARNSEIGPLGSNQGLEFMHKPFLDSVHGIWQTLFGR